MNDKNFFVCNFACQKNPIMKYQMGNGHQFEHIWRCLLPWYTYFLVFIFSFEPASLFCFITLFSPFSMLSLLLLKVCYVNLHLLWYRCINSWDFWSLFVWFFVAYETIIKMLFEGFKFSDVWLAAIWRLLSWQWRPSLCDTCALYQTLPTPSPCMISFKDSVTSLVS